MLLASLARVDLPVHVMYLAVGCHGRGAAARQKYAPFRNVQIKKPTVRVRFLYDETGASRPFAIRHLPLATVLQPVFAPRAFAGLEGRP